LPVIPTYPGVYIEELPSSNYAVTAAPTSVTVFIGFTNPFWIVPGTGQPPQWNTAVEVQNFSDYTFQFGGFFTSPWIPDYVGQAVSQFFNNGGSNAYVVAVPPAKDYLDPTQSPPADTGVPVLPAATATVSGFTFTAIQPVGQDTKGNGLKMSVAITNLTKTKVANDTADITIVYGTSVETYRRVVITPPTGSTVSPVVTAINGQSRLVSVAAPSSLPAGFTATATTGQALNYTGPPDGSTAIDVTLIPPVFAANGSLDKLPIFNLMAIPGITDNASLSAALPFCEEKRAFFIMDTPPNAAADSQAETLLPKTPTPVTVQDYFLGTSSPPPAPPQSKNGAIYFPYLQSTDFTGAAINCPPSGFVAGIFAQEDVNRGVWKSPAGLETVISGTTGVVPWGVMTDPQQGLLNPLGINCLRTFPGIGTVVFGARTLVANNPALQQWKYVAVRRMALFIEQSLYGSLKWAVFEPNDTPLWNALTQEVTAFMLSLFRQGAFAGTTANTAFKVQCDSTTTTATDIAAGIVNILVSFAPLSPAEFVVIQIQQLAGQSQA
jgi:phage tail sheath protein FI